MEKNFFNHLVKNDLRTYENIKRIATGQGNYYTTGCLLARNYFKYNYKVIPIDKETTSARCFPESNKATQFYYKSIEESKGTVSYF